MKRMAILVLCAAQWVCVSFLNSGCRRLDDDFEPTANVETTPFYFELAPDDIVKNQRSALLSGDGEAAYRLFLHYEFGFVRNDIRSTYWLRKSGELGYEEARQALTKSDLEYLKDRHVTRLVYFDLTAGDVAKYQRQAIGLGDGEAAYRLYLYYQIGCVIDDARAIYWLRKSGVLGYGEALHELNLMGIKLDN